MVLLILGYTLCSSTICTKFNVQIGAGQHLKGFGLDSLSGARGVAICLLG